jgi:drug/metabolite transporter (DMT)-like permease
MALKAESLVSARLLSENIGLMGSAFSFVAIGALLFFVLSAKRKAPKGKPGENDIVLSLRAAALGGVVGLGCFLLTRGTQQSTPPPLNSPLKYA